ncbi:MAG: hypothetical protein J4432_01340 [DPANN group archaeon]|nr:hypothetical protein [DPANN group archaeon]
MQVKLELDGNTAPVEFEGATVQDLFSQRKLFFEDYVVSVNRELMLPQDALEENAAVKLIRVVSGG